MEQLFDKLIASLNAYNNERASDNASIVSIDITKFRLQDALNDYIDARIEKSGRENRIHI